MITPSFFGLYNASRGLMVAQNALSVVNNNITNANTAGYSRQSITLTPTDAYTVSTSYQNVPNQIGQGVNVQSITRNRDEFLDAQYRQANGYLGLDNATSTALQQVEGTINEPSTDGINTAIQTFFNSAQEMSTNPESSAVRAQFTQSGIDLVSTFQQKAQQLADYRKTLVGDPSDATSFTGSQLNITANTINDKLAAITNINQAIIKAKSSGAEPNTLMDQRDQLVDDLSKLVDVKITNYDSGQMDVSIGGQTMIQGSKQVDKLVVSQNTGTTPSPADVPSLITTQNGGVILNDGVGDEIASGTLKGISDMGGNDPTISTVYGVLSKLNTLLTSIVTDVNNLQVGDGGTISAGRDLNGNLSTTPIFVSDSTMNPAQTLNIFHFKVNTDVINNPKLIAAASDDATAPGGFTGVGDGSNALKMANLLKGINSLGTTYVEYLNATVSKLGTDTQSYQNKTTTQQTLVDSVQSSRQSISGVNTDEETIDLLKYQRAFEASSKVISTLNQIYQTIIGMV